MSARATTILNLPRRRVDEVCDERIFVRVVDAEEHFRRVEGHGGSRRRGKIGECHGGGVSLCEEGIKKPAPCRFAFREGALAGMGEEPNRSDGIGAI